MGRRLGEESGHAGDGAGARENRGAAVPNLRPLRVEELAAGRCGEDAGSLHSASLSDQTPRGGIGEEGGAAAGEGRGTGAAPVVLVVAGFHPRSWPRARAVIVRRRGSWPRGCVSPCYCAEV